MESARLLCPACLAWQGMRHPRICWPILNIRGSLHCCQRSVQDHQACFMRGRQPGGNLMAACGVNRGTDHIRARTFQASGTVRETVTDVCQRLFARDGSLERPVRLASWPPISFASPLAQAIGGKNASGLRALVKRHLSTDERARSARSWGCRRPAGTRIRA